MSSVILHAVCPRTKKKAAKRFPVHKETLHHSQLRYARIACCDKAMRRVPWRRRGTTTKLCLHDGPRWPRWAIGPSL